ncbi:MAG: SurA N-terminal domain-containing protein, partial [Gemmatimonadota bacterium]
MVAAFAAALLLAPGEARTQQGLPDAMADAGTDSVELVDRVAAVVADTAILVSAIQQEIVRQQSQGLQVPQDPAAIDSLARATLDRMIDETLLLQRAKREGVEVGDQEVDAAVEEQFNRIRSTFDSDQDFRDAVESAGMNMFQFRQMWRRQIRANLLRQRFQQQLLSGSELPPATVTEEEIRR